MTPETHRESFALHPIGQIESEYHSFSEVPHPPGKGGWNEDTSTIALYPEHSGEISGLDGYMILMITVITISTTTVTVTSPLM